MRTRMSKDVKIKRKRKKRKPPPVKYYINKRTEGHATGWINSILYIEFFFHEIEKAYRITLIRRKGLINSQKSIIYYKAPDLLTAVEEFGAKIGRLLILQDIKEI